MFSKIKEKWNNQSLRTKFTICILIAGLLPAIVVSVLLGGQLFDMVRSEAISGAQKNAAIQKPDIENLINEIENTMNIVAGEEYYRLIFDQPLTDEPKAYSGRPEARAFDKSVRQIVASSSATAIKIYIDSDDAADFNIPGGKIFESEKKILGTYWHGIFNGKPYSELFCPTFYLSSRECRTLGNQAYIRRVRFNMGESTHTAYVAVYYERAAFEKCLQEGDAPDGAVSYIVNERDSIVASSNNTLSGLYAMSYQTVKKSIIASNSFVKKNIGGTDIYAAFNHIDRTDWFMVTIIPQAPINEQSKEMIIKFFSITLLFIIIALVVAIWQTGNITKRIQVIEKRMRRARLEVPIALPEPTIRDEVGELISSYNYMTEQINELIREEEKNAEELRIAEFNSLQAQINPHFLYNTMDMINWMAVQGKNEEVSETVQDLAKFYKLTLSRSKTYSVIQDEIEHAEVYIQLQNRRFEDKIKFFWDVPGELLAYRIPKLTFQPIIENAILHGIMEKEEKEGTIVITAWAEDNHIHIQISDDGAGMDRETLESILSEKKKNSKRGTNIAVYNIHRRLKLLYGDKYGLSYESAPGEGCTVTIIIPKHIGEEPYKREE